MGVLKFLGLEPEREGARESASETETVRRIVGELENLDPRQARFVAAFAFILSRAASADLSISPEETRVMEQSVTEFGGLPEQQAILVVHIAKHGNVMFGGTENFVVTRAFAKTATRDEKLALLRCLFAVSAADRTITSAENKVVRQITDELRLDHGDFISIRSEFRKYLAVLRTSPNGTTRTEFETESEPEVSE